jgi:hypothetical protein
MEYLVFLDFDGVLHPAPPHNRDVGVFCHLESFEMVMRDFPNFHIVISSSWRQQFSLDALRSFFSDDIAERIVGTTPLLPDIRQREIEQYLLDNDYSASWIALDDADDEFEPGLPNVVLCNAELGFDARSEADLREKLKTACNLK